MQFSPRAGILCAVAGLLGLIVLIRGCGDEAAENLAQFESPEDVIPRLQSDDEAVAWQAATDLGRMRATVALSPLSECLRTDERPKVRAAAALSLGRIDNWGAVDPLLTGMNDKDRLVRASADEAIVEMIGVDWQFDPDWDKSEREEWLEAFADHIQKERGGWESWQKRRKNPYQEGTGE